MMINCPKCGFLQDKEQYCAQCGVNMESWKPPKVPAWKKLASNWMFQLGFLFLIILAVVMRDNLSSPKTKETYLPPVENSIARDDSGQFERSSETQTQEASLVPQTKTSKKQKAEPDSPRVDKQLKSNEVLKQQALVQIYSISRASIEKLIPSGRRIDDGVYIISGSTSEKFRQTNSSEIKNLGRSRKSFKFGQPSGIFLGEEDLETGTSLGFFTELTVDSNSSGEGIYGQGRAWNQLKLNDEASPPISFELSFRPQDTLVVIDPTVHDYEFSEEERTLFEASRRLSEINDEAFIEGAYDIVYFIEIQ